jgi:hypothetical protein
MKNENSVCLTNVLNGNSYIITWLNFSEKNFPQELITKNIKIWYKINSPCTNNRNINFCILAPLIWKWVELQYPNLPVIQNYFFSLKSWRSASLLGMSWVFFRTSFKQVSINTLNLFDYLDLHYCEKI